MGVQPGSRLVQEHDLRVVDQREGDADALLQAAGQVPERRVFLLFQVKLVDQTVDVHVFRVHAGEVLTFSRTVEQVKGVEPLGEHANLFPDGADVPVGTHEQVARVDAGEYGVAEDIHEAPGRRLQALDDLDRRRLAGPIRAQQSANTSPFRTSKETSRPRGTGRTVRKVLYRDDPSGAGELDHRPGESSDGRDRSDIPPSRNDGAARHVRTWR